MRIANEDAAKTRRENHAATAELLDVPNCLRVLSLHDKLYLSRLGGV